MLAASIASFVLIAALPARASHQAVAASQAGERACGASADCAALERRCQHGVGSACTALGDMFWSGRVVRKDVAKSETYWKLGCDNGDGLGCDQLGSSAADRKDFARALQLFSRGCTLDVPNACSKAGLVARSTGNAAQATTLFRRGCDLGDKTSCDELQGPAPIAPKIKVDEATEICLRLLDDPTNDVLTSRLRNLGPVAVGPMMAQIRTLLKEWSTPAYGERYAAQKSLSAREARDPVTGLMVYKLTVPPMSSDEVALLVMAQRLADLNVREALPVLQTILRYNEPIRVYGEKAMDAAITRLGAGSAAGIEPGRKSSPPPSKPSDRPTNVRPLPSPTLPSGTAGKAPPEVRVINEGALLGTWHGEMVQPGGLTSRYSVELVIRKLGNELSASVQYPTLNCTASWSRPTAVGNRVVFYESVVSGRCISGWISAQRQDSGELAFTWHQSMSMAQENRGAEARATLRSK